MSEFIKLRKRWKKVLIGETREQNLSMYEKNLITTIDTTVADYLEKMCQSENRTYLWEDERDFTQSQKQTNNYRRLFEMCKAYSIDGSRYYRDKTLLRTIQEALEFLYIHSYNNSYKYYYGNWWNFEIGTPITLLNIMSLLEDDLPRGCREKYCEVIYYYQPNPTKSGERSSNEKIKRRTSVGGNRVDTAKIAILLGIHTQDENLLKAGRDALDDIFEIKEYEPMTNVGEKRDSLYKDWSFIQHGDVAYTGTYGNVLLSGLGELIYLLSDSQWKVENPKIDTIYQMILNSFVPIIYKGHAMDCVNGRGATRQDWQNNRGGHSIVSSILWFTQFVPEHYKKLYQERVKYWLLNDKVRDYVETNNSIACINMALALLEDKAIDVATPLSGNFAYPYMDRMIHHREHFSCALSMSSHRIRTYECMLGENKRGFYTGDGMLYIYNDDQEAYNYDFWATINPYKLTGVTLVNKMIEDGKGSFRTPSKWVSAMSIDVLYGIAGMQLDKSGIDDETGQLENTLNIDLQAKKSYFMLENEIVALGSDIRSSNSHEVYTIVDTRKLKKDMTNKIRQTAHTFYIEGNNGNTSMGYYFFKEQQVKVEQYTNKGCWHDVNSNGDKVLREQNYITISIDHGKMPTEETYAYSILPNKTIEELASYEENPNVSVLKNTKRIQAIRYKNLIMINFWEPDQLVGISVSEPVSMGIKESEKDIEITLCDPTKENANLLEVVFEQKLYLDSNSETNIQLEYKDNRTIVKLKWQDQRGQALRIRLRKA